MRLRNVLAAVAAAGLFLALLVSLPDPAFWPPTLMLGVLTAALLIERRRYGAGKAAPPGALPTDERFIDPSSGMMVRVWYDPATGERSYIDEGGR